MAENNISANGTVAVKTGTGQLLSVSVTGAGTASTLTLYDDTSAKGTPIATLDTSSVSATVYANLALAKGLVAVAAGTGAATVTIYYE